MHVAKHLENKETSDVYHEMSDEPKHSCVHFYQLNMAFFLKNSKHLFMLPAYLWHHPH